MKMIFAWIKKYIFHIKSPSVMWGYYEYEYEWDILIQIRQNDTGGKRR